MEINETKTYGVAEIDGFKCLLSYNMLSLNDIPNNYFLYSFRHDGNKENLFVEIQESALINHSYDVISKNKLDCDKINKFLRLSEDNNNIVCRLYKTMTLGEYINK